MAEFIAFTDLEGGNFYNIDFISRIDVDYIEGGKARLKFFHEGKMVGQVVFNNENEVDAWFQKMNFNIAYFTK